jgi:hypothetical protein
MMLWLIHLIARRLKCREIVDGEGTVYLKRYRVFGWLPGDKPCRYSLYLHHFQREDQDRELHNHPWKYAVSLVLAGGYEEQLVIPKEKAADVMLLGMTVQYRKRIFTWIRRLRPFRINILRGDTFHRVHKLHGKETWTLFLCGPKASSWGFLTPDGIVPWREFLTAKGITPDYEEPAVENA